MVEIPLNSRVLSYASSRRFEGGGLSSFGVSRPSQGCGGTVRMRGRREAVGRKRDSGGGG